MHFTSISPMLTVPDIETAVEFYTTVFGFTCQGIDHELGWARLERGGVTIMFAKPNEHIPFGRPQFTGSLYINITGVDELWEQVKTRAKVCYEIENFDYGMREFAVYDNNGYLLQFGQEVG